MNTIQKPNTRILYVSVAPIQNVKPYRLLKQRTDISSRVVYLKRPIADVKQDKESITKAAFDTDLLSGYDNAFLKTFSLTRAGFFSFISFEIFKHVREHDIIVIHGHPFFTFWLAMLACRVYGRRLIQTTDATYMEATSDSRGLKLKFKPLFLRWLYNHVADAVFVTSTASRQFLESIGINPSQIIVIPYAVDEDLITNVSRSTDVRQIRSQLCVPMEDLTFIFCAKFLPRKRPLDVIRAFANLSDRKTSLVMIGKGPLMTELQNCAESLGVGDRVKFPGLIPYSKLPAYYSSANVLVFSSEHEPYGLPVNEAMLCGIPVIVSDRIGARLDLVEHNVNGWIYKTGDVTELTNIMEEASVRFRSGVLEQMGQRARRKMETWSSVTNMDNQLNYFKSQGWIAKA